MSHFNKKQKAVIVIGLSLILLSYLFPCWMVPGGPKDTIRHYQYAWMLNPPHKETRHTIPSRPISDIHDHLMRMARQTQVGTWPDLSLFDPVTGGIVFDPVTGKRVFDPVTGELIFDPVTGKRPDTQKTIIRRHNYGIMDWTRLIFQVCLVTLLTIGGIVLTATEKSD